MFPKSPLFFNSIRQPLNRRICNSSKHVCMSSPWHSSTSIYSSVSQRWSQTERLQPAGRRPYRPVLTASDHAPEPYPRLHAWYPPPEDRQAKHCIISYQGKMMIWGFNRMELNLHILTSALHQWQKPNLSPTMLRIRTVYDWAERTWVLVSDQQMLKKQMCTSRPYNMTLGLQRGQHSPHPPVPVSAADDGCWWGWEVHSLPLVQGLQRLGQTCW